MFVCLFVTDAMLSSSEAKPDPFYQVQPNFWAQFSGSNGRVEPSGSKIGLSWVELALRVKIRFKFGLSRSASFGRTTIKYHDWLIMGARQICFKKVNSI